MVNGGGPNRGGGGRGGRGGGRMGGGMGSPWGIQSVGGGNGGPAADREQRVVAIVLSEVKGAARVTCTDPSGGETPVNLNALLQEGWKISANIPIQPFQGGSGQILVLDRVKASVPKEAGEGSAS